MLWLLLPFLIHAQAKTVLLQCQDCSAIEYKAMLKAHSAMTSPVQEYIESHPTAANRERLFALFSEAQKDFLSKSNQDAAARFEEIVKMIPRDDWERGDREIFLHALLRLAQMENSPEKRDRWLGSSLVFRDVNPASDLFPPPLLERREEIETQVPKRNLARKLFSQGWDEVLIDGRPCAKDGCEAWPLYPSEARVTLLSNRWAPQTKTLDPADLDHLSPSPDAFVSGSCGANDMSQAARDFADSRIFWGVNCRKSINLAQNKGLTTEPAPLFTTAEPTKPQGVLKSPWFWGGIAAVVITAVVLANSKNHETTQTTTTYGY